MHIIKTIPSLVIGFNLFSSFQYPLARADYNDENKLTSLTPGCYKFIFEIPPFTLSDGEYKIVFDIAERNIKRHTTENLVYHFLLSKMKTASEMLLQRI